MYHPFAEALALTLVDIQITTAIQLVFSAIIYFLVGLQNSAQQFFTFYLLIVAITLVMKAYYRTIAAANTREEPAQAMAGLSTLLFVLYTGYTIPKPSIIKALRWITNINVSQLLFST